MQIWVLVLLNEVTEIGVNVRGFLLVLDDR